MKEYLAVLLPLLQQGQVRHQGDGYCVATHLNVLGATPPTVLLAALAPKMLALAGKLASGTITWMVGIKTLRDYLAPAITQAAKEAGRAAPEIIVPLPICVCDDAEAARAEAGRSYAAYKSFPSYRAMLDREGATGPQSVAIVGNEDAVLGQLRALASAGATTFVASAYPLGRHPQASIDRTRAVLKRYREDG